VCGCHQEFSKNAKKYSSAAPEFHYIEVSSKSLLAEIYNHQPSPSMTKADGQVASPSVTKPHGQVADSCGDVNNSPVNKVLHFEPFSSPEDRRQSIDFGDLLVSARDSEVSDRVTYDSNFAERIGNGAQHGKYRTANAIEEVHSNSKSLVRIAFFSCSFANG